MRHKHVLFVPKRMRKGGNIKERVKDKHMPSSGLRTFLFLMTFPFSLFSFLVFLLFSDVTIFGHLNLDTMMRSGRSDKISQIKERRRSPPRTRRRGVAAGGMCLSLNQFLGPFGTFTFFPPFPYLSPFLSLGHQDQPAMW